MQYVSYLLNMLLYQSTHFLLKQNSPTLIVLFLFLPPANEVCEGYVLTTVCQSFCSRGGGVPGQVPPPQVHTPPGRYTPRPQWMLGYGQQAYASHWNAFLFKNVCRVIVPEYWAVKVTLNEKGPFVDCSEKGLQLKPLFQESF